MKPGDILTHTEMCQVEGQMLQRGMTFRSPPQHGIILMSLRPNAPYEDAQREDGTLIYEGHDAPKNADTPQPKQADQPRYTRTGRPTENGKFADWTDRHKAGDTPPASFRVYEKLRDGIWTYRGYFLLKDYWNEESGPRTVFKFELIGTAESVPQGGAGPAQPTHDVQTRQIPTWVKQYVYKRDGGRCVVCGSADQLHFDHDLPFSRGGTSAIPENVRLLCARHNLSKGDKIL
jgi:hypothetical protein